MHDFIVQVNKTRVQVGRIIDGELEPVRFSGETIISIENFWNCFKKKVEYTDDEALAFVIISNNESFQIDPNIIISDSFINPNEDIICIVEDLTFNKSVVTSYPEIEFRLNRLNIVNDELESLDVIENSDLIDGNTLQAFYRKKTRDYKRR